MPGEAHWSKWPTGWRANLCVFVCPASCVILSLIPGVERVLRREAGYLVAGALLLWCVALFTVCSSVASNCVFVVSL